MHDVSSYFSEYFHADQVVLDVFLLVSFRVFKYYRSFYGKRNEEFMVCLLNDHLVAEAIELREGKMNSNHLHDFKNSGFCKYVELSTLLIHWPK